MAIDLRRITKVYFLLSLGLLLACIAYWPGLSGGFLFDDFGNLPALGATGPVHNAPTFWRYITSGTADPTGRPLTLLSFLLDARDWPTSPYPFKRTNLVLHLINGTLLFHLLKRLGEFLSLDSRRIHIAALVGSVIWLLHPLWVSTTLYIVQREAMLPATFAISGLLFWLHGRTQLAKGHIAPGVLCAIFGLGLFTVLGTLAKANGALIPLYALLIEYVVLAPRCPLDPERGKKVYDKLVLVLGIVPSIAIIAYLSWAAVHGILIGGLAPVRSWTIAQRLMTEPRVLLDYLELLWIPHPYSSGLFNDQFIASASWLQPISTLLSAIAVFSLIVGAWILRKWQPAIALCILFFFAGQLPESTSIPLELYFEHRNYVPSILMFWPLALWLADIRVIPAPKYLVMIVLPIMLACMTYASAKVWGNVRTQALTWASITPDSPRAQVYAAQTEMHMGRADLAVQRLQFWLKEKPQELQLSLNLITARCLVGGINPADLLAAQNAMRQTNNPTSFFTHWFESSLPIVASDRCSGLNFEALLQLIDAGLVNPRLSAPGQRQDLVYLRGRVALAQHQPDAALNDFIGALDFEVRSGMAMEAAARLGIAGYPNQGLMLLDHYDAVRGKAEVPGFGMPMLHAWVLTKQHYWTQEEDHLRTVLMLDAQAVSHNTNVINPKQSGVH